MLGSQEALNSCFCLTGCSPPGGDAGTQAPSTVWLSSLQHWAFKSSSLLCTSMVVWGERGGLARGLHRQARPW